jgi:hypothetical protein
MTQETSLLGGGERAEREVKKPSLKPNVLTSSIRCHRFRLNVGTVYIHARRYDEAIAVCQKMASENPTFGLAHFCLSWAYWGKRMYSEVIEEQKAYGQLSRDRYESDLASALEQGFRSAEWKGALAKGIEIRQAQRKTGYYTLFACDGGYALRRPGRQGPGFPVAQHRLSGA